MLEPLEDDPHGASCRSRTSAGWPPDECYATTLEYYSKLYGRRVDTTWWLISSLPIYDVFSPPMRAATLRGPQSGPLRVTTISYLSDYSLISARLPALRPLPLLDSYRTTGAQTTGTLPVIDGGRTIIIVDLYGALHTGSGNYYVAKQPILYYYTINISPYIPDRHRQADSRSIRSDHGLGSWIPHSVLQLNFTVHSLTGMHNVKFVKSIISKLIDRIPQLIDPAHRPSHCPCNYQYQRAGPGINDQAGNQPKKNKPPSWISKDSVTKQEGEQTSKSVSESDAIRKFSLLYLLLLHPYTTSSSVRNTQSGNRPDDLPFFIFSESDGSPGDSTFGVVTAQLASYSNG
ncbi:hypothetical protein T310_5016 [Rasamsonia emersonii CBS 393.64]|uniref:Uncharacterized protein n=1 Tax=Rasamsonia emersonii (strain ATCC 16479 / CBS 393.64 / IMI 116815) TaxID=1408163 RepID=A0A0F4YSV1_RASE3|nr:hypothetical protein T310_5016 [Rasamsonia emersonii CBS 393.64]KKA20931.1 hypothetical protein T310_5016 [Rasamsonia emersonii CBS 393.64]